MPMTLFGKFISCSNILDSFLNGKLSCFRDFPKLQYDTNIRKDFMCSSVQTHLVKNWRILSNVTNGRLDEWDLSQPTQQTTCIHGKDASHFINDVH